MNPIYQIVSEIKYSSNLQKITFKSLLVYLKGKQGV